MFQNTSYSYSQRSELLRNRKTFQNKSELIEEMKKCYLCKSTFSAESTLSFKAHIHSAVHGGQKCHSCEKIFFNDFNLELHIRSMCS